MSDAAIKIDGSISIKLKLFIILCIDLLIVAALYLVSPLAALIATFGLICLALILINPIGLIYFLILTAPLISAVTNASSELNYLRIMFTTVLIVYFLARMWFRGEKIQALPSRLTTPLIVLFIYILLTAFLAKSPFKVLVDLAHLLYYLIILVAVTNLIKSYKNIKMIILIMMIMMSALSFASLVVYNFGTTRVGLLSINPNTFATILITGFGYALFTFFTEKQFFLKSISLFTLVLTALAVVTTGSRGGYLALLIFFLSFLWLSGHRKATIMTIVAGLAAGLLLMANNDVFWEIAKKTRAFSGLSGRPELWKGGLGVISDHLLFGVGMGCVGDVLRYYMDMANPLIPLFTHIPVMGGKLHNGYLQTMAELGIIGSLVVAWANFRFVKYLIINMKRAVFPAVKVACAFGLSILITFYCRALYESTFPLGIVLDNILILVAFGVIIKLIELKKAEAQGSGS